MTVRDGKISTLFAVNMGNNEFEVMGQNLLAFELYLNSGLVDFDKPVMVTTRMILEKDNKLVPGEKKVSFHQIVKKDTAFLLLDYKDRRDPELLYDAKFPISLENDTQIAANP